MKYQYTDENKSTVRMERKGKTPLFIPRGNPAWKTEGVETAEQAGEIKPYVAPTGQA